MSMVTIQHHPSSVIRFLTGRIVQRIPQFEATAKLTVRVQLTGPGPIPVSPYVDLSGCVLCRADDLVEMYEV